jgi:hypothetical protein
MRTGEVYHLGVKDLVFHPPSFEAIWLEVGNEENKNDYLTKSHNIGVNDPCKVL